MSATLVTGIAGGLARRVAELLRARGETVVGVDYREVPPLPAPLEGMEIHRASYNKTAIEDVFRRHAYDAVLHLGRIGNLREEMNKRFDLNVLGSQKLLHLCVQHHVRALVVLSTFHIYGADPRNPIPIREDEPLRAGAEFPQIADAIQLDNMAATFVYQHPEVRTVVLRPTNVVGPTLRNTMSTFLRRPRVPTMAGFNPMVQLVHEDDLARAIVAARSGDRAGVFNVAGPTVLPWRAVLDLAEARPFPLPSSLVKVYLRAFSTFPEYLVNFYKYPCVIDDAPFRRAFHWEPRVGIEETIASTVRDARAQQQQRHDAHA